MNSSASRATPDIGTPDHQPLPDAKASMRSWKQRYSAAGLHLFERESGLNILVDEVPVPASRWSRAPRQVSIALTNRCDLACRHCYAPKSRDELRHDDVLAWLAELDTNGTLGVGFGGGEPTLYHRFAELCHSAGREMTFSVSFTTHGHHISKVLADELRGSVHFIRVSMDGIHNTYESIRKRSFLDLQLRLRLIRTISRFGINIVVNERTLVELDDSAALAADFGACELLLLPQIPVRSTPGITDATMDGLRRWVHKYSGPLRLCISEACAAGFPTCDPLNKERGLLAYAHIDAAGVLKPSSYHAAGVSLNEDGVLAALDQLTDGFAGKTE